MNGTEYRYVVVSEDAAGNQSTGVAIVAVPRQDRLRSPKNGARLRTAPKLVWAPDAEAVISTATEAMTIAALDVLKKS